MTVTKFMAPFLLGMMVCAGILWSRVDSCRASSPTGQCAIWIDAGGVQLDEIQWPESPR